MNRNIKKYKEGYFYWFFYFKGNNKVLVVYSREGMITNENNFNFLWSLYGLMNTIETFEFQIQFNILFIKKVLKGLEV